MNSKRLLFVCLILSLLTAVSCATTGSKVYHERIMRGSIVDESNSEVYICIGSKDGAVVGQELTVYRIVSKLTVSKGRQFEKQRMGTIRILEIVDEHFAKSKVISGAAAKNDIVELEK